jgi:dihydrofolate reductase
VSRLIFAALASLDGYMADEDGQFDWAVPDAEEHRFVNDLQRGVGLHLYGRRMYEVLVAWETMALEGEPDWIADYARIWRAADKVVYSSSLQNVSSDRTRIERAFDPDAVRRLKAEDGPDMLIGGPTLAARAFEAGLVDEVHLFVAPVIVGGGLRALPEGVRLDLELTAERRFGNGVVYLGYRLVR